MPTLLKHFRQQLSVVALPFALVLALALIFVFAILGLHHYAEIPLWYLTSDVSSIGEMEVYAGMQSQIGLLLWAASTAVCFLAAHIVTCSKFSRFFAFSGVLSLVLGLDDMFLLHENVFPNLGVSEKIVYVVYIGMILAYIIRFHKLILSTECILLCFAFFCFGMSMTIDSFLQNIGNGYISRFGEDAFKFVGIVSWLFYFSRTSSRFFKAQRLESTSLTS